MFISNWTGPVYWSVAGVCLLGRFGANEAARNDTAKTNARPKRSWVEAEHAHLHDLAKPEVQVDATQRGGGWCGHVALLTLFTGVMLASVMAACTALRTHLFIWTVFSPKYLFAMAWGIAWHLGVSLGLGGLTWWMGKW